MRNYVLRRLVVFFPMLVAITLVTFLIANVAPGDPITTMINPDHRLREGDLERARKALGLDKPIPVRYVLWLGEVVQGNFGYSTYTSRPVLDRIVARILPTLELVGAALLISMIVGTAFGVMAALRQYGLWDYGLTVVSLFGLAIPAFFFGLVALLLFGSVWQVMPVFGMSSGQPGFSITDNLHHLVLPAGVLSIELIAANTRYARTAMLEEMRSDYVVTARAKGLTEFVVIWGHAFRNALLPLITIASLRLPLLLGGAVVIETVFSWPGMGLLAVDAVHQRDYPTLMGLTFFTGLLVLVSNLLADILYAYADPRIRV